MSGWLFEQWLPGRWYVATLPVGQGSCAYMLSPSGHTLVFDCGTNGVFSTAKFFRRIRSVHARSMQRAVGSGGQSYDIAKLIISHPHVDHFRDLASYYGEHKELTVGRLQRDREMVSEARSAIESEYRSGRARSQDVEQARLLDVMSQAYNSPAPALDYGADFAIKTFQADSSWLRDTFGSDTQRRFNNGSIVAVVECMGFKWILPGDVEAEGWEHLLSNPAFVEAARGVTHFVTSHHGHNSGWHPRLVSVLGLPSVWVTSTVRGDSHCADAYCRDANSIGITTVDGEFRRSVSTKNGHVVEWLAVPGAAALQLSDIPCLRNDNQQRLANIRREQLFRSLSIPA